MNQRQASEERNPPAQERDGGPRRRRRRPKTNPPKPSSTDGQGSADALDQIELMTGSPDTVIRLRAVPNDRTKRPEEFQGRFSDIEDRARRLNADGYNIYIVAQQTGLLPAEGYFVKDADVTGVRCLYVDGDDSPLPEEWHCDPTFTLVHPETNRWWAFWRVGGYFPVEELRDYIKRLARRYDGDPNVCNPARIVRLAGFGRWKAGKNYDPYELRRVTEEEETEIWWHATLPDLPERERHEGGGEDAISERRLRGVLAFVEPFSREVWLKVGFAIRDGVVLDDEHREMDYADKLALFDEWSSGALHDQHPGPTLPEYDVGKYEEYEDCENLWNSSSRDPDKERVGFGSVIHLAKEHAAEQHVDFPEELGRPAKNEGIRPVEGDEKGQDEEAKRSETSSDGVYPEPLSSADLVAGDFPPPEYAWQDFLLARHVNLLHGAGGTGKTLLALHVAAAVAAGVPLVHRDTRQMPALLVLAEDDYGETKARLQEICDLLKVKLEDLPLHTWCLSGHDLNLARVTDEGDWEPGPFLEPLRKKLDDLGPCFLVLDTVSDIATLDESKRGAVNTLCKKVLARLCRDFGATILVNGHPSKASIADGTHYWPAPLNPIQMNWQGSLASGS